MADKMPYKLVRIYISILKRKDKVLLCEKEDDRWFIRTGKGGNRYYDTYMWLYNQYSLAK
jgi:hypothetical protein